MIPQIKARRQILKIKYKVTENNCHVPIDRTPNRNGYINTNFNGIQMNLHRLVAFAWLDLNIDDKNELSLHKLECQNKACFNKEHLYVGNHSDNTNDSVKLNTHHESSKTKCHKGHELDGIHFVRGKLTGRYCKTCKRESARRSRR